MHKQKFILLILLALILGASIGYNLGFFYFLILAAASTLAIKKFSPKDDVRFLVRLFLFSLVLRVIIVLIMRPFIILYGNGVDLFGDGMSHGMNGYVIAETIRGATDTLAGKNDLSDRIIAAIPLPYLQKWGITYGVPYWVGALPPINLYQVTGFAYFLSFIYYFLGFSPIIGIFFNCLLGSLLGALAYFTVKKISPEGPSPKIAAILISFWPSMILWSTVNLKEMLSVFISAVLVFFIVKISLRPKWQTLFFIFPLTIAEILVRDWTKGPLALFYLTIGMLFFATPIVKRKLLLLAVLFLITVAVILPPSRRLVASSYISLKTKMSQEICSSLSRHRFQVFQGGTGYRILNQSYYDRNVRSLTSRPPLKDVFSAYMLGAAHFVLEPLPWKTHNLQSALGYLQSLLVYFLIFFFLAGIILVLKTYPPVFFTLFSYFFIFASTIILNEGNLGGLLRHRDITTPVFIVFASLGLAHFIKFKGTSLVQPEK